MASPQQQQQPQQTPPPQPPPQPPPPSLVTNIIGEVVSALSTSLSPVLAYDKLKPVVKALALTSTAAIAGRALKAALSEVDRFPQPRLASVGLAQRNMIETNTIRRAAYVVSAAQRMATEMTEAQSKGESIEAALSEAVSRENIYFLQHTRADSSRMASANRIDSLAIQHGDTLGWYSAKDGKTTPECLAANGKNFRASDPPKIGYPGSVHVECRCSPGPPHRGAEMLDSDTSVLAAANSGVFDVLAFSQQIADLYQVPLELATPRKKMSKVSQNYRKADPGAEKRCGTCVMYHASKCDLVLGYIEPSSVCDSWEAPKKATHSMALELVGWQDMAPNAVKHVRTPAGVAMFHKPIGSPITEAEYQSLLAARKAAKGKHPVGHPDRLAAERAVRQARKQRSTAIEQGGEDAHSAVQNEVNELLGNKNAPSTSTTTTSSKSSLAAGSRRTPSTSTVSKTNVATRADDKRLSQGQTVSNFVHPDTGEMMSKSSIGDTYEELFKRKGAHLLEKKFGGKYEQISHASGGARNTPLDFQIDHTHGGELKTLSINSKYQKTAIKKEEIDRKLAELAKRSLSPLLVVQVVDQSTGNVTIYSYNAFVSKRVHMMEQIGSYKYTKKEFSDSYDHAGYGKFKMPTRS